MTPNTLVPSQQAPTIWAECKACKQRVAKLWDANGDRWKLAIHLHNGSECWYSEASVVPGGTQVPHRTQPTPERPAQPEGRMTEVGGDKLEVTLADFERSCLHHITLEQAKSNPDTWLIRTLCNAVRLKREYGQLLTREVLRALTAEKAHEQPAEGSK